MRQLLIVLGLLSSSIAVAPATMVVHDPTSFGTFTSMLNATNSVLGVTKETKRSLESMRDLIGEVSTIDQSFIQAFDEMIDRDMGYLRGMEDSFCRLAFEGMSLPERGYDTISNYLNDSLHIYTHKVPALLQQPEVIAARNKMLQQACLGGMTLGVVQKQTLKQSTQHVKEISKRGLQAPNLLTAIKSLIELTTLQVKETIEIKAILAAQLELQAARTAQGQGLAEHRRP